MGRVLSILMHCATAFGRPIYGEIVLWPHRIWAHISGTNGFGPDSIWAVTIKTNALWPNAFGPAIYGKIASGPHCIWTHISCMNAFGPNSIYAEYY